MYEKTRSKEFFIMKHEYNKDAFVDMILSQFFPSDS